MLGVPWARCGVCGPVICRGSWAGLMMGCPWCPPRALALFSQPPPPPRLCRTPQYPDWARMKGASLAASPMAGEAGGSPARSTFPWGRHRGLRRFSGPWAVLPWGRGGAGKGNLVLLWSSVHPISDSICSNSVLGLLCWSPRTQRYSLLWATVKNWRSLEGRW